jgi:ornithine carbamoyltransferase
MTKESEPMRHFLKLLDLSTDDIQYLLEETAILKAAHDRGDRQLLLTGKVLGMVFEKPSLRTRASFEAAMAQLGGNSIFLSATDGPMGQRESVPDFARTLCEYVDAVVLRVFRQHTVEEFAAHSRVPVINGLSDLYHPCQALGDVFTIQETFGSIPGRTVVFIGDGNNVARSLAVVCARLGANFILSAPDGYGFDAPFLRVFRERVGGEPVQISNPIQAVRNADVIYTDVWTSMGQEAERECRLKRFANYQVNAELLDRAPPLARVMHCLPAHRGEEITDEMMDGERSIVFPQAANRMHVQKALLKWLML